jgi:hypothetical protein
MTFVLPATASRPDLIAWVGLLYRDILGRVPASSELTSWTAALNAGVSRDAVAASFLGSPEYAQKLVTQWFEQYLQRLPDSGGLTGFSNALLSGVSERTIREAILSSPEYASDHGGLPANFVGALYHDILGRAPGGSEADSWVTMASTGDRLGVISGILASSEFHTDETINFYQEILRRNPDPVGLNVFVSALNSGTDERFVLKAFVGSFEYFNSARAVLWLEQLYRDVLARNGSGIADLGSWLALLNSGTDRSTLAQQFSVSTEAETRQITNLYQQLLRRRPDATGLDTFLSLLQSGGHVSDVVNNLVASPEYYNLQGNDNTRFINGIYNDVLSRLPTSTELVNSLNALGTGTTRAQLIAAITGSLEYRQIFITSLFSSYLRRSPTASELSLYVGQLQAGASDAALRAMILSSDEYFNFSGSQSI